MTKGWAEGSRDGTEWRKWIREAKVGKEEWTLMGPGCSRENKDSMVTSIWTIEKSGGGNGLGRKMMIYALDSLSHMGWASPLESISHISPFYLVLLCLWSWEFL